MGVYWTSEKAKFKLFLDILSWRKISPLSQQPQIKDLDRPKRFYDYFGEFLSLFSFEGFSMISRLFFVDKVSHGIADELNR